MNNVLLSLETSPLFQSINEGSSYQDFIYKLQDGIGSLSKHRMEIPFNSIKSNTTATFDLPEYGLVHRLQNSSYCSQSRIRPDQITR